MWTASFGEGVVRVAYVNADCGIPVFGDKGAAVHIREMVRAMGAVGCDVRLLSARLGGGLRGDLAEIAEHVALPDREPASYDPTERDAKERSYIRTAEAIERRLVALNDCWPIDLVYERYSLWSAAGVRAARRIGVPVVLEVNAPLVVEQAEHRQLMLRDQAAAFEKEAFSCADAIIVVSEVLAGYVKSIVGEAANIVVMGNGVDTKMFHPDAAGCRGELGFKRNDFVIGFTGSLKNWHGVDTLLRGFRFVNRHIPESRLLIVGDGPKKGWIAGFADGAGLSDIVLMTGWVDHERLPSLVASMDVATAPYPQSENCYFSPLKLYEYLAMGRPVVASNIGQISELIDPGKTGLLVPPGDPEALASALIEVRRNVKLAREIGINAAEVGKRHSWSRNAKAVVEITQHARRAA